MKGGGKHRFSARRRLEAETAAEARYLEDLRSSAQKLETERKKLAQPEKKKGKHRKKEGERQPGEGAPQ